LAISSFYPT